MCGIAGFIDVSERPDKEDVLQTMTKTLRHRGPDDMNTYFAAQLLVIPD